MSTAEPTPNFTALANRYSRAARVAMKRLVIDGEPFDPVAFPWTLGILDDDHPHQVLIKGAQVGITITCILRAIDRAEHNPHRGCLYLFPTRNDVSDFSKARFARILEDNPVLSDLVLGVTNATNIKQVGETFFYFRGTKTAHELKSVPADELILDERDEMLEDKVELAYRRLDQSKDPHITELSTPTIPGYGIDLAFAESDQHHWMRKCLRCGHWMCLEESFPELLVVAEDDTAFWQCGGCKEPFESHLGEWVPKFPDRPIRGRWISQLNSRSPTRIADLWVRAEERGGAKLREFYNSTLGVAYADEDDVITREQVLACCDDYSPQRAHPGPTCMGIDVGKHINHYQIREKLSDTHSRVLRWGAVKTFAELSQLLDDFNVAVAVIDEMAETRTVRRWKAKHAGVVWGNWYAPARKGAYHWDVKQRQVHVNRTEALDDGQAEIAAGHVRMPRPTKRFEEEWIPQLCNLARIRSEDPHTGQVKMTWEVKGGAKNDHMRHALALGRIAMERCGLTRRVQQAKTRAQRASRAQARNRSGGRSGWARR